MSTQTLARPPSTRRRAAAWARTGAWGALALFLAAFAVFESVKYGLPTTTAAVLFFVLPDAASRFAAGHRRVVALAHNAWLPIVVLVAYPFSPVVWPPVFTAGLAWLTRLTIARTVRRG